MSLVFTVFHSLVLHIKSEVLWKWWFKLTIGTKIAEMLPLILPSKTLQPTHPLPIADLSHWFHYFLVLHTNCEVSLCLFKLIYVNGAIWNSCLSTTTFVLHRISQKMRQANSFINWADMQIRKDKLQILCDKVSSTAGFLGRQCSEGSCCCYHGGPSLSFTACPAINDAQWISWNHSPCCLHDCMYLSISLCLCILACMRES